MRLNEEERKNQERKGEEGNEKTGRHRRTHLRRRNHKALLALKLLLYTAIEEERDVCVFVGF
jgi:hypothetical protein